MRPASGSLSLALAPEFLRQPDPQNMSAGNPLAKAPVITRKMNPTLEYMNLCISGMRARRGMTTALAWKEDP
jgi:hypothetical protein